MDALRNGRTETKIPSEANEVGNRDRRLVIAVVIAGCAALAVAAAAANEISARGLRLSLPTSWKQETPSSSMRLVQAAVPGSGGAGQFTVFHFGPGGGGGVEENLARWIGQMDLTEGTQPERSRLTVGDLVVHWVDASGTLEASRIGSFPQTDEPGYRLFGAVVEGPGGPWFLRLVGPGETLAEQREAFLDLLQSLSTE